MIRPNYSAYENIMQRYTEALDHADVIYKQGATLSAQRFVELLKEKFAALGAPEYLISAIQVFTDDDGVIHVGVPENHPLHSEAVKYEYGDLETAPAGVLRSTVEETR